MSNGKRAISVEDIRERVTDGRIPEPPIGAADAQTLADAERIAKGAPEGPAKPYTILTDTGAIAVEFTDGQRAAFIDMIGKGKPIIFDQSVLFAGSVKQLLNGHPSAIEQPPAGLVV